MIRSAEDVIAIAKSRGFKIVVDPGPPPMPRLSFRVAPEHAEKQRDVYAAAYVDSINHPIVTLTTSSPTNKPENKPQSIFKGWKLFS